MSILVIVGGCGTLKLSMTSSKQMRLIFSLKVKDVVFSKMHTKFQLSFGALSEAELMPEISPVKPLPILQHCT